MNNYGIGDTEYENDKRFLSKLIQLRRDSINSASPTQEEKVLDVFIDTIFYNTDNKIVFLAITKKEKPYTMNPNKISFSGECYIGINNKESNKIEIIDQLKYKATSDEPEGFQIVKELIQEIYLTESLLLSIGLILTINDFGQVTSGRTNKKRVVTKAIKYRAGSRFGGFSSL